MSVYEIKKETIQVCGQPFEVFQADLPMSAKRDILMGESLEKFNDNHVSEEDKETIEFMALRYIYANLYPSLICCTVSHGEPLPTLEEFIGMPSEEQQRWENKVKEFNPHFFNLGTEEKKS